MSASSPALRYEPDGYRPDPADHPGVPPRELDGAFAAAAARVASLASLDRELNFVVDASGALRVELRDLDGGTLEAVSPTRALSIMSGLGVA